MNAWLWGKLPSRHRGEGPSCACCSSPVLAVLLLVVFPWLEPTLPFNDVTVARQRSAREQHSARPLLRQGASRRTSTRMAFASFVAYSVRAASCTSLSTACSMIDAT